MLATSHAFMQIVYVGDTLGDAHAAEVRADALGAGQSLNLTHAQHRLTRNTIRFPTGTADSLIVMTDPDCNYIDTYTKLALMPAFTPTRSQTIWYLWAPTMVLRRSARR